MVYGVQQLADRVLLTACFTLPHVVMYMHVRTLSIKGRRGFLYI